MAANGEVTDRYVIPRWRPFREALATGELAAGMTTNAVRRVDGERFVKDRESAWLENRTLPLAVDLVSAATVLGTTAIANQAAEFVLANEKAASPVAGELAKNLLGILPDTGAPIPPRSRMQVIRCVKDLKARRIREPRNAFVWVDLARLYILLGQKEPARQALSVALELAPGDRFVVRCAARFFHHVKDHGRAVELLRKNPSTPFDSWLVAAEIAAACAAEKTPKFAKIAAQMLQSGHVPPFHASELASALAGLEMTTGKYRLANRLFSQSLAAPTENALAQAVWASKKIGMGQVSQKVLEKAKASEAMTWDEFNRGHWERVVLNADDWAQEEAFSARPRLLASNVAASFLDKPALGEEIARMGLAANPGHPTLVNNAAFSMTLAGKPSDALNVLEQADTSEATFRDAICLLATAGLAHFRLGHSDEGKRLYGQAITKAKGPELEDLRITASLYLARERASWGEKEGIREFRRAFEAADKLQRTHIPALARHMARDVEKAAGRLGVAAKFERKPGTTKASEIVAIQDTRLL